MPRSPCPPAIAGASSGSAVTPARPPLGTDRLEEQPDGRLTLRLETRWRDGTTHVLLERSDLLDRLVPLIPPPRTHQVRYYGILAPCASQRSQVVPVTPPGSGPVARDPEATAQGTAAVANSGRAPATADGHAPPRTGAREAPREIARRRLASTDPMGCAPPARLRHRRLALPSLRLDASAPRRDRGPRDHQADSRLHRPSGSSASDLGASPERRPLRPRSQPCRGRGLRSDADLRGALSPPPLACSRACVPTGTPLRAGPGAPALSNPEHPRCPPRARTAP
jgi:hypothetical protein